jgi:CRP/FNR family transcriptional regulator
MGVGKLDLERLELLVQNSKVHHQNDLVLRQNDPASMPPLQHQLMRLSSKEINTTQAFQGALTAEQKLATFIHNLAVRNEVRGFSATHLRLVMTRQDIANHLGMAAETISRMLKQFQSNNILMIKNREMMILDPPGLLQLTGCSHS